MLRLILCGCFCLASGVGIFYSLCFLPHDVYSLLLLLCSLFFSLFISEFLELIVSALSHRED